ncbi:hypothetical protein IW261DRAFT_1611603 [Armillaria novae-zelandiae]|uniref:Uncharacterized protein n=1 Tax=Armillaria novae-zelandiae TaxID=153914 RepID=A0AA39NVD8_9AGAR|nr:hypothetical protein IW261DRAFT_1611603 [Armillaria novae-zelandiae]
MFRKSFISNHITLEAAGLVALADLSTVAMRTALTGTASYLDALVLAPGLHQQQSADEVNHGELPTTGAMTTGYVFHVENPATVRYLQTIGCTGHLVTARVSPNPSLDNELSPANRLIQSFTVAGTAPSLLYLLCPVLTISVFALLGAIGDWWGFGVLWMLVVARLINVVIIRQRSVKEWKGAKEPDVQGDLLILLSQDRWVRLRGLVDDIKAVTAGQWLREAVGTRELCYCWGACLSLAYCFAPSLSWVFATPRLECLQMYDRVVRTHEEPKKYNRRLEMAADLIIETGKKDWAIAMGLVKADEVDTIIEIYKSPSNQTGPTDKTTDLSTQP